MTHEERANAEHPHGPEHDDRLPRAGNLPGDLTPEQAFELAPVRYPDLDQSDERG